MINMKEVQAALREMYASSGMTQTEIAQATGVSQSYIADLLSGKSSMENLSLKKINQLFPEASLSLGNRTIGDRNVIHSHARVQSDNNFLPADRDAVEEFRRGLTDLIIGSEELSDEERGRFLRIIRSTK